MSFRVKDVEEYFSTLDQRFNASGAKGVDAIYQFELGDSGHLPRARQPTAPWSSPRAPTTTPTTTIKMTGENFVKMSNGDLKGQMAFMTGKMKIKGSIPMAMKMKEIFPQVG